MPTSLDLRAPGVTAPGAPADTTVARTVAPLPSLMAPPRPRNLTRVETTWRPFLGFVGNSWGTIGEARVEHYFGRPFMLGVELAPVAIASAGDGLGAATHVRLIGAYVTDYLSLGLGVGARLQRFGIERAVARAVAAPRQPGRPAPGADLHAHDRAQQVHG